MITFRIAGRWRWQMRFWAVISAGIVTLVSFVPGCQPSDDLARVALLFIFALSTVFLLWYDRALSRTVSIDGDVVESRDADGRVTRIAFRTVTRVVNHVRLGYLYVVGSNGQKIRIEHQFENVQDLVARIVKGTECTVEER